MTKRRINSKQDLENKGGIMNYTPSITDLEELKSKYADRLLNQFDDTIDNENILMMASYLFSGVYLVTEQDKNNPHSPLIEQREAGIFSSTHIEQICKEKLGFDENKSKQVAQAYRSLAGK